MASLAVEDDRSFPLDHRLWIPATAGGTTFPLGLRELFLRAHELDGLAVALPPAAAGLQRVLYAMTARLTGLDRATNADEWLDRRYALLADGTGFEPESVHAYFDDHEDGLRLHDPVRPFLQDPRLVTECGNTSGVNKLVMARPAGNNQVFFGHFTDAEPQPLASAEAVLHLIAQLYYGPSGQCTPRTVDGQRFGNTMAGPLRRALSTHPLGRNLYESLLLGLPEPGCWPRGTRTSGDGCPWERTELPDPLKNPEGPRGPLSMLTERYQHAVLLHRAPDSESVVDATITWGLRTKRPEVKDPYLIWDELKDGTLHPRDASAERALWRDLDALVLLRREDGHDRGRCPLIFERLTGGQLPEDVFSRLRVLAYGFDQDGQTRDRTYFTATTPPLFPLLATSERATDTELARGVRAGRLAAEKAAWHLTTALRSAWRHYTTPFGDDRSGGGQSGRKTGVGPWPEAALAAYWPAAEEYFWNALDARDFSNALPSVGRIALRVYDEVTASVAHTPRGAKARESSRGLVASLLKGAGHR